VLLVKTIGKVRLQYSFTSNCRSRDLFRRSFESPNSQPRAASPRGYIGCTSRLEGCYTEIYPVSTDTYAAQPLSKKTFHMTSYRATSPAKKIAKPSESKQVETALLPKEGEQVRRTAGGA
jgi:hypothetical protein